jgi:hypothetical protein
MGSPRRRAATRWNWSVPRRAPLARRHAGASAERTAWEVARRAGWKVAINDAKVQRSLAVRKPVAALDGTQMLASGARYVVPDGAIRSRKESRGASPRAHGPGDERGRAARSRP